MKIVNKTEQQIKESVTPERIKQFKQAMRREPTAEDMADPDLLTPTNDMIKKAVRAGRPKKELPKEKII